MFSKFYRPLSYVVVLLVALSPVVAAADCSGVGYTIIFVNGILNTPSDAQNNRHSLEIDLPSALKNEPIEIRLGYNPSHLEGGGDALQSLAQAFNTSISDFDLKTILMQIYPEVKTRKILLVGHSQGTFYTNELYKYLVDHGVPQESIAVYNIATPASYVAGGGLYITSTNDKAMNWVRDRETSGNVKIRADSFYTAGPVVSSALRANITIPKEPGWDSNDWGGHHFSEYMSGAGDRIVSDIDSLLARLKAVDTGSDQCFEPPQANTGYKMRAAAFAIADPLTKPIMKAASIALDVHRIDMLSLIQTLASTRGALADTRGAFALWSPEKAAVSAAAAAVVPDDSLQETHSTPSAPQSTPEVVRVQELQPEPAPTASTMPASPASPASPEPPPPPASPPAPVSSPPLFSVAPGFGGGGGAPAAQSQATSQSNALSLTVSTPLDGASLPDSSVIVRGTSDAGALITADDGTVAATTSANAAGAWDVSLSLADGAHSIAIQAESAGHTSASVTLNVTVDTVPPATTTLSIADCAASLVSAYCVLPVSQTALTWSAVPDAAYYGVAQNGTVIATTTETNATAAPATSATTTLALVSYDRAGNTATSTGIDVYEVSQPLVINEIGWAGDDSSVSNQWIELKNTTAFTLDLSHIALTRAGNADIALSGTLGAANPYLIVEPIDIPFTGSQKLVTAFPALSSTGERLALKWNGTATIDETPSGNWAFGSLSATLGRNESGLGQLTSPFSMERKSNTADGTVASNWQNTDSYGPWLGGSNTDALWGTPAAPNSDGYPDAGVACAGGLLTSASTGFNPGSGCTYLTKFVMGSTFGATRYAGLYRGTVGSSTIVTGHSAGKALALSTSDTVPSDAVPGENYFFAIWEVRTFGNDAYDFNQFFTLSASTTLGLTAPHGNYVTIPFIYAP